MKTTQGGIMNNKRLNIELIGVITIVFIIAIIMLGLIARVAAGGVL